METQTIYGHKVAQNLLNKQLESSNFAHAYLFSGPSGVGKYTLAKEFAGKALNHSVADFFELDLAEQNSIEELRQFLSIISVRPVNGQWKVAILNNFDLASPILENALLKTLEEPSSSTILILVASGQLLPTIISRCQVISFNRLSVEDMTAFAKDSGLVVTPEIVQISAGSPSKLIGLVTNSAATQKIAEWTKKLEIVQNSSVSEKLLLVSELGSEETSFLREVLLSFLEKNRSQLNVYPESVGVMRKTMEALELLKFNLNKKLALQRLLL